ncbi:MAG: histidinol dehydrogenase [Oscillospiraceae bacterium]|jgi:histidinol dehydrogenase|nr:histidinol dehydrogenase [Oscillospiraceae bacterium]
MLKTVAANGKDEFDFINGIKLRAGDVGSEIDAAVSEIMWAVKTRGYAAVEEYSLRFDKAPPREISIREAEDAYGRCSPELIRAMERASANIRSYQEKLLTVSGEWGGGGAAVGCIVRGIQRLGIYVPGGTAAYPSSVLMTAVPAKVAGVEEIIMVTPPTDFLSDEVLAAAKIAGVDRIIACGGAHAVAALTYGAGFIPQVDKLVGPGNAYVASAKRMAYGTVDIDMVAGPSEILIIADGTAEPEYVAADLLSQAEHDRLASCILITDCAALADEVKKQVGIQLEKLPRRDIAAGALESFGGIIICGDLRTACELGNVCAPEHLEIMTENPRELLPQIRNAGAVFLGKYTPEPLGDYMAGPSHVLPTSGTARFFSPLSVDSFLKKMSVIEYSREALAEVSDDIVSMAKKERLDAHANSISVRRIKG